MQLDTHDAAVSEHDRSETELADEITTAAVSASTRWGSTSPGERAASIGRFLDALEDVALEVTVSIAEETGRREESARAEVRGSIRVARDLIANAMWAPTEAWRTVFGSAMTKRRPVGAALLITPANFPISSALRKVVPALMVGNSVVLKPSELTPRSGAALANAARVLPGASAQVVHGGPTLGAALIETGRYPVVSFTGSTASGRRVAEACGRVMSRVQLETGGKNCTIFDRGTVTSRSVQQVALDFTADAGQSCSATSRVVVMRGDLPAFRELIESELHAMVVGSTPSCSLGPLITERAAAKARDVLAAEIARGVEVATYGTLAAGDDPAADRIIRPSIVWGAAPDGPSWTEELFAPILSVATAADFEDALSLANSSKYGLATAIFTDSIAHADRFVDIVEAGKLVINGPLRTSSPQVPMMGLKDSGFGGPENGVEGMNFFSQPQAIYWNRA